MVLFFVHLVVHALKEFFLERDDVRLRVFQGFYPADNGVIFYNHLKMLHDNSECKPPSEE